MAVALASKTRLTRLTLSKRLRFAQPFFQTQLIAWLRTFRMPPIHAKELHPNFNLALLRTAPQTPLHLDQQRAIDRNM